MSNFLRFTVLAALALTASAFAPATVARRRSALMALVIDHAPTAPVVTPTRISTVSESSLGRSSAVSTSPSLIDGVNRYLVGESSAMLSLKERPPPPTKEEIAEKQRNFNFWFWGGGFVAPFLATFYYFGFKFWEK